jgi:hypothetical protein
MPTTYYATANGMLIGEQTNGVSIDYVPDALGSIVAAINQSLTTTYTAAYTPYGTVPASTGTAPNFTWVGNLGYLAAAGRPYAEYSVRARIFSSKTSHWTSVDPLWASLTRPRRKSRPNVALMTANSAYVYAACAPVVVVDPRGLSPVCRCVVGPCPKNVQGDAGSDGSTDCDPWSGQMWTCISETDCTVPCVLAHKAVHRSNLGSCCTLYGQCYTNALKSPFPYLAVQACDSAWKAWNDSIQLYHWDECAAYTTSVACDGMGVFHNCPSPQACCADFLIALSRDEE